MKKLACSIVIALCFFAFSAPSFASEPPSVGQKAPDFELSNVLGKKVSLSSVLQSSPVVLVVLRGYPGYQCPFCVKQVHDFVQHQAAFEQAGYRVVFVYPGPPAQLGDHAQEFLKDAQFPSSFEMLLDPGYSFTNAYGLRWDAANETAYPSTFLISKDGNIFFSMSSKMHGGRSSAAEILAALPKK
ncbi:putative bacterioferritin comigratory protein (Bcp) [Acidisarcina polymorpha]|uniref:thioredoxin-dependent peroxiredoxin n=1 Tax=Acidisarcina polymorpha TaxID=2211140 RepID=A0A2Z5G6P7_9BACT|nr:peroxiredoxin family protein [Acidisarcina polymorpha]AXC14659.1 putative bacterioferritin comigratory protein (Bcp) [Acidisarcina polymorpha]